MLMDTERLVHECGRILREAGIGNGLQEARWLMEQLLEKEGTEGHEDPEAAYRMLIERRLAGEPLQYIMGSVEFHCVDLVVGPGVLIPRPETEQLVELALSLYPGNGAVCDLCTGSGAIALALARQLPDSGIVGIDISEDALRYALLNKERLGLQNASFLMGDLFEPLPNGSIFSMMTANPPYVSQGEYDSLEPVVRDHEPRLALLAGSDGLAVLRRIASGAAAHLRPGAPLVSEIGESQGRAAQELFRAMGYRDVSIRKDYSGRDRFLVAWA